MMAKYFPDPEKAKKSKTANPYSEIVNWFGSGNSISILDDLSEQKYKEALNSVPGLKGMIKQFNNKLTENQRYLYMEFLLNGLAEYSQVSKAFLDNGFTFADMFNSLFSADFGDEDDDYEDNSRR
jgi:magnesium chelatase subunit I